VTEVDNLLPGQEVAQVHELAMLLVLDVDDTPPVFATTDALPIDHDCAFRANNCEGNHRLRWIASVMCPTQDNSAFSLTLIWALT